MTLPVVLPAEPLLSVDDYLGAGGGVGLRTAREYGSDATIDEITAAGLTGRGGGGFSTGAKWRSIRDAGGGRRYVVANGAEGEPATFKDRMLMRRDPFRIVEGAAIAALAVGADDVYLATKASFTVEAANLRHATEELGRLGFLDGLDVTVVGGPDEYLFGEEKALLEVIEGREPLPRQLPPWQHGLFATVAIGWESGTPRAGEEPTSNPTLVNNVETLAAATHILERGAEWFRSMGTVDSPGTVLVTVVGDVVRPGVHEVEMGTPFSDVLARCGGPLPGRAFKAAFSGVSNAVLVAADFDVALTQRDLVARDSGLGAAGVRGVRRSPFHARGCSGVQPIPLRGILRPVPALQAWESLDHRGPRRHRQRPGQRRRPRTPQLVAAVGHRRQSVLPRHGGTDRRVVHPPRLSRGHRCRHRGGRAGVVTNHDPAHP